MLPELVIPLPVGQKLKPVAHCFGIKLNMHCLGERLIVASQIGFNLIQMVVGVCQGIMDVRRSQVRVLLHDLFNGHRLSLARQDCRYANARPHDDRLAAASVRVFFDVSIIEFLHFAVS
jgi:hypothetical protein